MNYFEQTDIDIRKQKKTTVLTKRKKKILHIGGSLNQTTMLHRISQFLPEYDHYFTAYYSNGVELIPLKLGLLETTCLSGPFRRLTENYIRDNNLQMDYAGKKNDYDLVLTASDLIVPKNIRKKKIILVQEGMTDPQTLIYHLVKFFHLKRYLASTATTGQSDAYVAFCVASEGYKDFFIRSGCKAEKIKVTGIPNYDNCKQFINNDFPYKDYVLVCTSDARETWKIDRRKKFILDSVKIANGRQMIFKIHPNEKFKRAIREVNKYAPGALVFTEGDTNHMVANCSTLIVKYSTMAYVGLILGKEVYSRFEIDELRKLLPIQNGGVSAKNIADVCRTYLE